MATSSDLTISRVKQAVQRRHEHGGDLAAARALFTDPDAGASARTRLWSAGGGESGIGGHIDFTSRAGFDWWVAGVKSLRELGIECIWNDNNEVVLARDVLVDPPPEFAIAEALRGLRGRYRDAYTFGVDGFFGASSMERLPTEIALTEQTRRFKNIAR